MNGFFQKFHHPVKRTGAQTNLLLVILFFGLSVIATRLFLKITGFPQLGWMSFHIAHVLWGGLFLITASILPLLFINRGVYRLSAILSGVGVGLFIDEVGKFITQDNNYFAPSAAPIVYAFFMLLVLLYIELRHKSDDNTRAQLYKSIETIQEAINHDLDIEEHDELIVHLSKIAEQKAHPDYARLARDLMDFLNSKDIKLVREKNKSFWEKLFDKLELFERNLIKRHLHRAIIIGSLAIVGVQRLTNFYTLAQIATSENYVRQFIIAMSQKNIIIAQGNLQIILSRLFLEGLVGAALFVSAALLLMRQDKWGVRVGYIGLLTAFSTVNLLVFYYDQFGAVVDASIQLAIFIGLFRYKKLYVNPKSREM